MTFCTEFSKAQVIHVRIVKNFPNVQIPFGIIHQEKTHSTWKTKTKLGIEIASYMRSFI